MIAEQSRESSLVCILDVLIFLKAYAFLGDSIGESVPL